MYMAKLRFHQCMNLENLVKLAQQLHKTGGYFASVLLLIQLYPRTLNVYNNDNLASRLKLFSVNSSLRQGI